ncbi:protein BNS1 [Rhypophila decipiens]|uniref:Protein BNS1 n=1 Tax=Rhypophila decipiens TaxID=261697 RepID=A0AAN6Y3Z5_9PEZI|nr:protein BNS1 [Rhypophila decipiens]
MASSNILSSKDVNTSMPTMTVDNNNNNNNNNNNMNKNDAVKPDVKSMEYHRQVFQSKIEQEESKTYISPSDNIMSPCTAKLSAFRNKQVGKAKPKSLFAQASAKKYDGGSANGGADLFGSKPNGGL